jgi:integrase
VRLRPKVLRVSRCAAELVLWQATTRYAEPDDFVLSTSSGRKHNPSNLRRERAVEAANVKLAKDGIAPLEAITFHSLRRTFASLRCACGDDVRYTAGQLGHEIHASRSRRTPKQPSGASGCPGRT